MAFTGLSDQNLYDQSFRKWNDGPLTWADYQVNEAPADPEIHSVSVYQYATSKKKVKIDNYKIVYNQVDCYLDRNRSWYNPNMSDDLELRSNQVVFDIWELCSRQVQNRSFGETTLTFNKNMETYSELAQKRVDEFEKECDNGQGIDTVVLKKYEESIQSDLKYTPRREPDLSLAGRVPDMAGFYFSYIHGSYVGGASDYLKPANGLSFGFDYINRKDWYFDGGFSAQFSKLKTGGFYNDGKNNYDWTTDKSTNHLRLYLNIGHATILNQYYRIIPYAGIAFAGLIQETDIPIPNKPDMFYDSNLNGISVMAGVNADWIMRHTIRPDERVDTSLRFRLFGAYDYLGGEKNIWSVNFGVAIHLNIKSFNAPNYIYIPIFI
jgi:hypothetical protein